MLRTASSTLLVAAGIGLGLFAFTPEPSFAKEPNVQKLSPQELRKNKVRRPDLKNKLKTRNGSLNQDQIYSVGYWQAKGGDYAAALATLRTATDQTDPRVQTMIGFSLRKLGRVEEAMGYYQSVLAAYPDRTTTRQYLGEAFLQIGDTARAREQLAEIAKRCGMACEDYQLLADEIVKFESAAG